MRRRRGEKEVARGKKIRVECPKYWCGWIGYRVKKAWHWHSDYGKKSGIRIFHGPTWESCPRCNGDQVRVAR